MQENSSLSNLASFLMIIGSCSVIIQGCELMVEIMVEEFQKDLVFEKSSYLTGIQVF